MNFCHFFQLSRTKIASPVRIPCLLVLEQFIVHEIRGTYAMNVLNDTKLSLKLILDQFDKNLEPSDVPYKQKIARALLMKGRNSDWTLSSLKQGTSIMNILIT